MVDFGSSAFRDIIGKKLSCYREGAGGELIGARGQINDIVSDGFDIRGAFKSKGQNRGSSGFDFCEVANHFIEGSAVAAEADHGEL